MNAAVLQRMLDLVPLFEGFTADELSRFLAQCNHRQVVAQEVVIEQDSEGEVMYAVMTGKLRVVRRAENSEKDEVELAVLGPGDVVGELVLVDSGPRSASVISLEPGLLIGFNRIYMDVLPESVQNKLNHNIATQLAQRLRQNNKKLSVLLSQAKTGRKTYVSWD
jgi:CRP-like cAMP-binding protein